MDQTKPRKIIKPVIAIIVVLVLAGLFSFVSYVHSFHVVSTNPPENSFATVSPFFDINFNETLSSSGVSVTSNPGFIGSYTIHGKSLDISITHTPLNSNTIYTITINTIYSSSFKELKNIQFKITPEVESFYKLSKTQQNDILSKQSSGETANQVPTYTGTSVLISSGVSVEQVQGFEQAVSNFAQANRINLKTTAISTGSISPDPLDKYPPGTIGYGFVVSINNVVYTATLLCTNLTQAELILNNSSGTQVFDSGAITNNNPD